MTQPVTAKQFVCPTCNRLLEEGSVDGKPAKPKCTGDHSLTELTSFWKSFLGGMLWVPFSYVLVKIGTWISPVLGHLIWAFVGLWPVAVVVALFQGIGYFFRSGPVRELAPQTIGMALGMVFSLVPIFGYFLLTSAW
jgi:hypothetical protein